MAAFIGDRRRSGVGYLPFFSFFSAFFSLAVFNGFFFSFFLAFIPLAMALLRSTRPEIERTPLHTLRRSR